ncbi:MAG: thioesterase family protein [Clostridia bacterium]
MKQGLQPGATHSFVITVKEEMRPAFEGQVVHDVMSTVSMVHYMEWAGRQIILSYLEEDEEGVGFAIDAKHVGMAVVGQQVRFQATCTQVTSKRVVCDVIASTDENMVGQATFTQVILPKAEIMGRIHQLLEKTERNNKQR